jgi:hypothetical protein
MSESLTDEQRQVAAVHRTAIPWTPFTPWDGDWGQSPLPGVAPQSQSTVGYARSSRLDSRPPQKCSALIPYLEMGSNSNGF